MGISLVVLLLNLIVHAQPTITAADAWVMETDVGGTLVIAVPDGIATGIRVKRRAE